MPSCEITGSAYAARVTYTVTQDVALNRSVVRITRVEMRALADNWNTLNVNLMGWLEINGTKCTTLEYTSTTGCGFTLSKTYAGGGEGDYWFSGFKTQNVTVNHGADGSAQISVYANLKVYYNGAILGDGISKTVKANLPTIPRVSAILATGVELGKAMTINISRASASFTDTVYWSCGSWEGTIAEKTQLTQLSWAPPLDLAFQAPEDTQVAVTLTVVSYSGETTVGSSQITVNCTLPGTIVPYFQSVEVTDGTGCLETYGGFVQSQSRVRVTAQAVGDYGSTIRQITVRCGQLSGTGADVSFVPGESGKLSVTVTATDSRGRTATHQGAITVLPYQKPWATVRETFRCDENGEPKSDGLWMKVVFDAGITELGSNSAVYRGVCTVHNGEDTRTVLLEDYTGQLTVTGGYFLAAAGMDTGYDCQVSVQDDFCTVLSGTALVSVGFALMDFCRDTKAVGIGMRARNPGKLSIGLDTDMEEHTIGNLADPAENQDAVTKAYVDGRIFPVGYVYLSTRKTSPASIFGGTWERLKDVFLLAAGSTYAAGATGGEAEHKLTYNEMPTHSHGLCSSWDNQWNRDWPAWTSYNVWSQYNSAVSRAPVYATQEGGDAAHNNMPPYLAVYMWKRVA